MQMVLYEFMTQRDDTMRRLRPELRLHLRSGGQLSLHQMLLPISRESELKRQLVSSMEISQNKATLNHLTLHPKDPIPIVPNCLFLQVWTTVVHGKPGSGT